MSRKQRHHPDPTAEMLAAVEETAAELRLWAARLEEAVERNRAVAQSVQEQACGGDNDAGTNDE